MFDLRGPSTFELATIDGVIDRLEQKGLVQRIVGAQDRRAHQPAGVGARQAEILASLSPRERSAFVARAHKALGLD